MIQHHPVRAAAPRPTPSERPPGEVARSARAAAPPLIAVIGCDGSGKSTVAAQMLAWARRFGAAEAAHLGKQSGNVGRAVGRLPLVGGALDRVIVRKTAQARAQRGRKAPGALTALVIHGFTVRRVRRFRRMLKAWRGGAIIVADRYPQLEAPDAYDGTGFSVAAPGAAFARALARRERRQFEWMTGFRPDLVIRLNVDFETAFARKPDHRPDTLRAKIAATPLFRFDGAPIVDIDARRPLDEVLAEARDAVTRTLVAHGYAPPDG